MNSIVSKPAHYTKYKVEVIEITRYLPFCLGNVVKYVLRAPYKGGAEDCDKALVYLGFCQGDLLRLTRAEFESLINNIYRYMVELETASPNDLIARIQYGFLERLDVVIDTGSYEELRPHIENLYDCLLQ